MQRRHTTPSTLLPAPPPPPPRQTMPNHDPHGGIRRPRQPSVVRMRALSLPKGATRHVVHSADPVPWDRSLRSSQPTYIPGSGLGATRRPSSKGGELRPQHHHHLPELRPRAASASVVPLTAASVAVMTMPAPPPLSAPRGFAWRRTSAAFSRSPLDAKDVATPGVPFDCGLSTSVRDGSPFSAEASRRPSAHSRRPSTHHVQRPLRGILGSDARDEVATLTAYTSPNAVIFSAYDTLRLLLIPLWKRYRHRKQVARATSTVAKFVLAKVHGRRLRRRARAADSLRTVLQAPRTLLLCAVHQVGVRVVRIQRAFRLHRRCVRAVVELNYRKVRRDVEEAYWAAVVDRREAELAAQPVALTAVGRAVQEVLEAKREVHTRFGTVRRSFLAAADPPAVVAAAPAPASYELDVYNFYMIGRLPETTLRSEIASAVYAHTRRSAVRACLLDALCTPKHPKSADTGRGAQNRWRISSPTRAKKPPCVAHLPRFLPEDVYNSVMNNTCYMTSLLRDDAMLRAHLRPRASHLEPY